MTVHILDNMQKCVIGSEMLPTYNSPTSEPTRWNITSRVEFEPTPPIETTILTLDKQARSKLIQ